MSSGESHLSNLMAVKTDGCRLNAQSAVYGRVGARRQSFHGRAGRMQRKESEYSTDGLPRAFLLSLRTLFDILDDGRRGFVHLSEIESRWQGADTQELPDGVLESLRRVAPPHGCLTFERFVAGLRYSMLNPKHPNTSHCETRTSVRPAEQTPHPLQTKPATQSTFYVAPRMDRKLRPLGPSNAANTQPRASPLLMQARPACGTARDDAGRQTCGRSLERGSVAAVHHVGKQAANQRGRVRAIESLALESPLLQRSGSSAVEAGLPRSKSESQTGLRADSTRRGRSGEEQRRHTITNGVDYGMLKQMKELEQEKDSLLAGLDQVERARDWYQSQIHSVTERQRLVGRSDRGQDLFSEGSPNQINVLIPKMQEVNRCLDDLISCPQRNQCPPVDVQSSAPPSTLQRLKDQNRLLTQEVTEKSERITQLEREKSALIQQLFEARSAHNASTMDSTFI